MRNEPHNPTTLNTHNVHRDAPLTHIRVIFSTKDTVEHVLDAVDDLDLVHLLELLANIVEG